MTQKEWVPGLRVRKMKDSDSIIRTGAMGTTMNPLDPGPEWTRKRRGITKTYGPNDCLILLDEGIARAVMQTCFTTTPDYWEIIEHVDNSAPSQLARAFGLE